MSGDTIALWLKLGLLIFVIALAMFYSKWLKSKENAQAEKETDKGRASDQAALPGSVENQNEQARKSEQDIEDIINGRKP